MLLVVCIFLLTRSFILAPLLAGVIGERINANVSIEHATWSWSGVVDLEDLEIHVKGIEGEASRIALFDAMTVQITHWLPWQSVQITKVTSDHLTIRVAESEEIAGEFNFSSFMSRKLSSPSSSETPKSAPSQQIAEQEDLFTQIDLKSLTFEIGTMGAASWQLDNAVHFDVFINAVNNHSYQLSLVNSDDSVRIKGTCDLLTPEIALAVDPMQLDDSLFALLPKTARVWCDAIALRGDIGELGIYWDQSKGFQLGVDVKSLEFSLPAPHSLKWVHYEGGIISKMHGDPSLKVDSGRILFDGNSAKLENLQGVLLPPKTSKGSSEVPFQVSLKISELPPLRNLEGKDWFEVMKETSPFTATFKIDQFKSKFEGAGQVDLPVAVAKILQLFHLKDWDADGLLIVERSLKSSEIVYKGSIQINGGSGRYSGFAYPLNNIQALIEINNDTFFIQQFTASGSEGAQVSIQGEVTVAKETEVDLKLRVKNAPLDNALHEAVPKPVKTVMDRLLDQNAIDLLVSKKILEKNEVTLGGHVTMSLAIQHSGKEHESVKLSGDLIFKDTTVIHNGFPFPITFVESVIRLEPNRLEIPLDENKLFTCFGGGLGVVEGVIEFDENGNTEPNLFFKLSQVPVSPNLIEAVAVSSGDSYNTVLGVLGGLGLDGVIDAYGKVSTSEDGEVVKNITVNIEASTATPNAAFAKAIHATNAFWIDDFTLSDVEAQVTVNNKGVLVEEVKANFDGGDLAASMNIHGGDYELKVRATEWPISEQLVFILPPNASATLSPAWHFLEPTGRLDANIRMSHANGVSSHYLNAIPTELGISGNNETVKMHCDRGEIVVEDASVFLNELLFSLDQDGESQGSVTFDGSIQVVDEKTNHDIQAKWENAVVGSPLSRAITGIIGGSNSVAHFDTISPQGTGVVTLETVKDTEKDYYEVTIIPDELSATLNRRVAHAQFTHAGIENQNQIVFNNSGVSFNHLFGQLGQGEFSIDGKISTSDRVEGTLLLDWDGPADDQSLFAVLPSVVGDTLEAIEIGDGTSKVDKGQVSFFGTSWAEFGIDFHGNIDLHGVSLNAGLPLTEIDGMTEVEGVYDKEKLARLKLRLQLDNMVAVGRKLTNIAGGLVLDSDLQKMTFENVRGSSSSGIVTLTGWVGVDSSKEFQVTVLLAGVKLGDEEKENESSFNGELTGWLAVEGVRGESKSRIGVGEMQVTNGMYAKIPTFMRALQLLHFTLPTTSSLTTASINLCIDGEKVQLEEIKLTGDDTSVQGLVIKGSGTLEVPSFDLDVKLYPRIGWPVFRQIFGAIGDQFYAVKVTGQLLDPKITIETLPNMSQ